MIRTRSAPAGSRVLDESKEGAYHSLYRVRRVKYASSSSQSKLCSGQCAAARGWTAWTAQPRISATGTAARHASGWRQRPNLNSEDSGLRAMRPSSRSQSAATTALAGGTCELFRVKRLREIPDWWILGRCLPPIKRDLPQYSAAVSEELPRVPTKSTTKLALSSPFAAGFAAPGSLPYSLEPYLTS